MPFPFDQADKRILLALQGNGRASIAELGEGVGLSTSPTWRRVKKLENDGVITGYQAVLDRRALGWGVLAFVMVSIGDHGESQAKAFESAIVGLPEVVACWSIAGTSDFLLQVVGRDLDSFADFAMLTLRRLPWIKEMQTVLTLKEVKAPVPWPVN